MEVAFPSFSSSFIYSFFFYPRVAYMSLSVVPPTAPYGSGNCQRASPRARWRLPAAKWFGASLPRVTVPRLQLVLAMVALYWYSELCSFFSPLFAYSSVIYNCSCSALWRGWLSVRDLVRVRQCATHEPPRPHHLAHLHETRHQLPSLSSRGSRLWTTAARHLTSK